MEEGGAFSSLVTRHKSIRVQTKTRKNKAKENQRKYVNFASCLLRNDDEEN